MNDVLSAPFELLRDAVWLWLQHKFVAIWKGHCYQQRSCWWTVCSISASLWSRTLPHLIARLFRAYPLN